MRGEASGASARDGASASSSPARGRLFRRYFVLILALVTSALVVSGAIGLYFSYRETLAALYGLQREKAVGAAERIRGYVENIQSQLRGAALPQLGAEDGEQRRVEFLRLLKQVPEVTDLGFIAADGCERVQVSRLAMDAIGDCLGDRAKDPAFTAPTPSKPWYGPVTFRKETEPYMTIAVRSGGPKGPVTWADVNLKFMWDVISRIRVGETGKAYVVDRTGHLIADPDIGLVLRKSDLSTLAHVAGALAGGPGEEAAVVTTDASGRRVLAAHAPIEPLGWTVFVEQPVAEATAQLRAYVLRTLALIAGGLFFSALAAMFLARGMAKPIGVLQEGAQRIGSGELDHRIDIRTGDELEALAGRFNDMTAQLRESYAGLERKVDERTRELANALEQQTAISGILRVISSSPTDVKPVLEAVAERAAHLCAATYARVLLVDGAELEPIAGYQDGRTASDAQLHDTTAVPYDRTSLTGRAAIERRTIHEADIVPLLATEYPGARANMEQFGLRAVLVVPLVRESGAYGGIILARTTPGRFRHDQVELVETFARQAAIAIDNVRLFNETKEALEQQTAISEVLRVISSTPGDVKPMLQAVAERSLKLCDAAQATIVLVEGGQLRCHAAFGETRSLAIGEAMPLTRGSVAGRAVIDGTTFQVEDLAQVDEAEFPVGRELQRRVGHHTALAVPLMREGRAIGAIQLWRMEARPFGEKKVDLVRTFADQATLAIENVRLFNETKEALEQQKASAEVLSVISNSVADTRPVFDKILESCERLFAGTRIGILRLNDGMLEAAALRGSQWEDWKTMWPRPLDRDTVSGVAILDRRAVDFPDCDAPEYPSFARSTGKLLGYQSLAAAPLVVDGEAIGALWVGRAGKGNLSAKQLALLGTFADQAVIAIQNARLFNETKEALEQQKASSEVLSAISSSIADTGPVFDKILASCESIFGGKVGLVNLMGDDGMLRLAAYHGQDREHVQAFYPVAYEGSMTQHAVATHGVAHYPDIDRAEVSATSRRIWKTMNVGAVIGAPFLWEGRCIGSILIGREQAGPFSHKEQALLKTFADQAVIAIQNARLVNETREALERQTATAEVLQVISSSVADTAPVFDKILASGARLFATEQMGIFLARPDGMVEAAAFRGSALKAIAATFPKPLDASITGLVVRERRVIQVEDAAAMQDAPATVRDMLPLIGNFSGAWAPMAWEGQAIGSIGVLRQPPSPLNAKEVELLKTFADQAVIAIQNARLVNETREALEQQTATAEVLKTISRTAFEIKTVLDTLIDSATRLCRSDTGAVYLRRGDRYAMVACHGATDEQMAFMRAHEIEPGAGTAVGMVAESGQIIHFDDARDDPAYGWKEAQQVFGYRSIFGVPMLAAGEKVGVMVMWRREVRPFTSRERELVSTFADQAVIAIQNVRLLTETKEALEQQRASSEVLRTISSSIADTSPVFEQILASCERLFAGHVGQINVVDAQGLVHLAAYHGPGQAKMAGIFPFTLDERSSTGLAIERRAVLHYPDIDADPEVPPIARKGWEAQGLRSVMVAPMMWEGRGVGSLFVGRATPGPYSEKEIALLKTFADQAAIAIQNARLFREIADKSRQLEVANKHKSEFLANMSHELRTPLNAIIGFSEVLLERMFGDLNEKQDDYLKDIHSSGKHLLSLINDILDLSKVEAGRMELEATRFRVPEAIGNAMTLVRERAQRHGIALGTEVAPEVDEIVGDERKFKQILLNLLTNAVKFTPDGGRVDVIATQLPEAVEIAVRDTGIGISAEDQKLVFEEFRQVGHDYTRKQEGTGLGLALTRRFVELHGGTIRLESEPGKGSTFTFTLPLAPAPAPAAVEGARA